MLIRTQRQTYGHTLSAHEQYHFKIIVLVTGASWVALKPHLYFIESKFKSKPDVAAANTAALKAGWNYGETTEHFASTYQVAPAVLQPGTYRNIMGNQALAWGLITAAKLSEKQLFLGSLRSMTIR